MRTLLILMIWVDVASAAIPENNKQFGILKGKISASGTSAPLGNVNLELLQSNKTIRAAKTDLKGYYVIEKLKSGKYDLRISLKGFKTKSANVIIREGKETVYNGQLEPAFSTPKPADSTTLIKEETNINEMDLDKTVVNIPVTKAMGASSLAYNYKGGKMLMNKMDVSKKSNANYYEIPDEKVYSTKHEEYNTEEYGVLVENAWKKVKDEALSTFSIDVDAASYSNIRRFLNNGQMPPKDAVRIEEMVNYFKYNYPQPKGDAPFSITTEASQCPWNSAHQLVLIGMQGKIIPTENLPATNLTFLIDVSGSMMEVNKLPLVKASMKLLVSQLRPQDKVAIVVYAGNAGMVLPSTPGSNKEAIIEALDKLEAGGSTAGGAGIQLAYKIAKENFMKEGNNRVILCTDGDFNVGASSDGELVRMIEEKRKDNIFLTVLGFGMGNYKDSKMEQLADKGNGNHAYIDNLMEAKKVLVNEFGGTLFTIAKDVKLQVEWNPAHFKSYRLIGYENRMLNKEDFNDDKKDAGELGSGHTVTALYEVIPAGSEEEASAEVDPLKYQANEFPITGNKYSGEMLTVKLRYKQPIGDKSSLLSFTLNNKNELFTKATENMRWASTVAGFGMLLRDSKYKGKSDYAQILSQAKAAKGTDEQGYRAEFIRLVEMAQLHENKN